MIDNKQLASYQYFIAHQTGASGQQKHTPAINTIGILVHQLDTRFTGGALRVIREVADAAGFELIITNAHGSTAKQLANTRLLLKTGVSGVIASFHTGANTPLNLDSFKRQGVPVVLFDQVVDEANNDV